MWRSLLILIVLSAATAALPNRSLAADDSKASWGTLSGQVVVAGHKVPEQKPIEGIAKHPAAARVLAGGPILSEDWVVVWTNSRVPISWSLGCDSHSDGLYLGNLPRAETELVRAGNRRSTSARSANSNRLSRCIRWSRSPAANGIGRGRPKSPARRYYAGGAGR